MAWATVSQSGYFRTHAAQQAPVRWTHEAVATCEQNSQLMCRRPLSRRVDGRHSSTPFDTEASVSCAPNSSRKVTETRGEVRRAEQKSTVRITSVPPGDAPLWVREKWVGLELPIRGRAIPCTYRTVGAVTGPSSLAGQLFAVLRRRTKKTPDYIVGGEAALVALEEVSPDAAAWWRANAPGFFQPGRYLVFHETVCTPLI